MKIQSSMWLWAVCGLALAAPVASVHADINTGKLGAEYSVGSELLADFVQSYNFKCADEITEAQLRELLNNLDQDSDLAIMVEADRMDWRDLYVETRSAIECISSEVVSKGY
ncbi:hypothetical protein [Bermanella sp. R86510]|uniref:hypothetical protein n=1 Tax=unclassified Bermanella TaxID=2627862 RepID=UPI0037CA90E3